MNGQACHLPQTVPTVPDKINNPNLYTLHTLFYIGIFMKKTLLLLAVVAAALTGCATTNIAPQYVNPANYQGHDCTVLQSEVARISQTAKATENQNIGLSATGIGIGLAGGRGGIYPTISVGAGLGSGARQAKTNTLAKLYGEHDAMIVAARQKGCAFAQNVKIYGE